MTREEAKKGLEFLLDTIQPADLHEALRIAICYIEVFEKLKLVLNENADIINIPDGFGLKVISIDRAFECIDRVCKDARRTTREEAISHDHELLNG